jgi:surface protein
MKIIVSDNKNKETHKNPIEKQKIYINTEPKDRYSRQTNPIPRRKLIVDNKNYKNEEKNINNKNNNDDNLIIFNNTRITRINNQINNQIKQNINEPLKKNNNNQIINNRRRISNNNLKEQKNENLINNININNNSIKSNDNDNYIVAVIEITDKDVNRYIRIINSYEEFLKEKNDIEKEIKINFNNEKEIKDNCEIEIDKNIIPFSYFHNFDKQGKYEIKYKFRKAMTNLSCLFYGCKNLKLLNLSDLNTDKLNNMNAIFANCELLEIINLNNINTKNVTDMRCMFYAVKI